MSREHRRRPGSRRTKPGATPPTPEEQPQPVTKASGANSTRLGGMLGAVAPILLLLAVAVAIWFFVFRESRDDRVDDLMTQAREAMELFEYGKAESFVLKAIEIIPESGLLHHNLAALYMRQERYGEARQEFERSASLYGPEANEVIATEYFHLAELDVKEKKIEEAERHLRLGLASHPTSEILHIRLIDLTLAFLHDPAAADSITMDFLRLCGRSPKNLYDASYVHHRRRSYNSAIALARAAVEFDDSMIAAHKIVANSYWMSARTDEGLEYLQGPLERHPEQPDLWVARATLLIGGSRYEEALEDVDRAIQIDPDHYDACVARMMALFNAARLEEALRQANLCVTLTDIEGEKKFLSTQIRRMREQMSQLGRPADEDPSVSPEAQEQP